MIKKLLAATALLAVSVSPAFAKPATKTFTRDGESYSYSTIDKGDHIEITGRNQSSGGTFHLDVRGDEVSGVSGGVPVSFTIPGAQAKLSGAQVASR
jgi:hypothetical protein